VHAPHARRRQKLTVDLGLSPVLFLYFHCVIIFDVRTGQLMTSKELFAMSPRPDAALSAINSLKKEVNGE
jgi:hypothetical protein